MRLRGIVYNVVILLAAICGGAAIAEIAYRVRLLTVNDDAYELSPKVGDGLIF